MLGKQPAPALQEERPPCQCVFIEPLEFPPDYLIGQALRQSFVQQFAFEAFQPHRPARQRRLDPAAGISPIVKIVKGEEAVNDLFGLTRGGAFSREKTFDLGGRSIEAGEIPHGTLEPLVPRLRNAPFHYSRRWP